MKFNISKLLLNVADRKKYDGFWTAGSNNHNEKKDNTNYIWFTNGKPLDYTNWIDKEPNNYKGEEHCLYFIRNQDLKWNDNNCLIKKYFVCQRQHCCAT